MLSTLFKKWYVVTFFAVLFSLAVGYYGHKSAISENESLGTKQEVIDNYLEELSRYDQAINNAKEALELSSKQVDELLNNIENDVYMSLDANNLCIGSVQFTVIGADGTIVTNVLQALNQYVIQGGLKEDAESKEELGVKYWSELVSTNFNGATFSVSIMQPTGTIAKKSIDEIKKCMLKHSDIIAVTHGEFQLIEQDTSVYMKSEPVVINNQNTRRNDLKNLISNHADYEVRVNNMINTKKTFMENNKPDDLEVFPISVKKRTMIFGLLGLFVGIWCGIGISLIEFIAGNIIKNTDELKKYGLVVFRPSENIEEIGVTLVDADSYSAINIINQDEVLVKVTPGQTRFRTVEDIIAICKNSNTMIKGVL